MPLKVLFLVILPLLLSGVFSKRPNILLIIVDDLRPALGTYGDANAVTPNIDKLASNSFVFTKAFAQQALCAPSRNSFLTSRRPDSLHLYDFYSYWRDVAGNFTTLPQHFKENGYYTQSIGKVFHPGISSNFSDDSPYSWSGEPFHPKTEIYQNAAVCVNANRDLAANLLCPVIISSQPGGILPDLESLNAAKNFLTDYYNRSTSTKPYFLAVGFHKPHIPFKFPVQYLDFHPLDNVSLPSNRWRPSSLPTVAWNPWLDVKSRDDIHRLNISFHFGVMPDDLIKRVVQHYNAATTYIDDLIGELLQQVDPDTIIVLTSDHGWSRSEHGEFSKYSNFDVATNVPLIIHVPGLNRATETRIDQLVELVDLFPTLVDLTQISSSLTTCATKSQDNVKLCTEGHSLVPLMAAIALNKDYRGAVKNAVFMQYPRPEQYPTIQPDSDRPKLKDINVMGYSIRTDRYRYTEWVKFNHDNFTIDWENVYGTELYDHQIDPNENLNLADRNELSYVTDLLRKQLILGWRHSV